jgi:hypothetical protein
MKTFHSAFFAFFLLVYVLPHASGRDVGTVEGKSILHPDGSRTESVRDPNTREMEQRTFDGNGVLIVRKLYRLNEQDQPVMGHIYDGSGTLKARAQSFFDAFGRLKEERLSNLEGEVFQQIVHEYDKNGKSMQPKVINYKVKSPTMRPAMIDFTRYQEAPAATPQQPGVRAPLDLDAVPAQNQATNPASPQPPAQGTGAEDDNKKPGFFKRLFKKKD